MTHQTTATVSPVTAEQVPEVVGIAERSNLSHWAASAYEKSVHSPETIFLGLQLPESELAGFVIGRVVPGPVEDLFHAEIYNIAVEKRLSRRGYGRMLLRAFAAECRKRDVEVIWLEVRTSNRTAISFYESNGFLPAGVRKNFYAGPVEDGLLMRTDADSFGEFYLKAE